MNKVATKLIVNLTLVFSLVTGCATTGLEITAGKNKIIMPQYSIELPANKGWRIEKSNINEGSLYLTKRIKSTVYTMLFKTNWVVDENMKTRSAKQIADNYRDGEYITMMSQGVLTGQYELKNVIKSEEIIGESKFYTMKYTTVQGDIIQNAHLFLFFPNENKVDDFIVSLYSEATRGKISNLISLKQDFIDSLKSMKTYQ